MSHIRRLKKIAVKRLNIGRNEASSRILEDALKHNEAVFNSAYERMLRKSEERLRRQTENDGVSTTVTLQLHDTVDSVFDDPRILRVSNIWVSFNSIFSLKFCFS